VLIDVDRRELERSTCRQVRCEWLVFASLSCWFVNIHDILNIHHASVIVASAKLCSLLEKSYIRLTW